MRSTLQTLDDNRVKLSVEVDEAEFDRHIDVAFRRIAKEFRVPGFRPGKAPRRLLEARLGAGIGRAEALREAMPEYYTKAVIEHDVDAITAPEIEIIAGEQEGPVCFNAVVEIRPAVNAAGYEGIRIEIPRPEPSAEVVDERIDQMRRQYAELFEVDRPAEVGDHVTIDVTAVQNGSEVPDLTTSDYDYRVGDGAVGGVLDEHLTGASAGDSLEFEAAPAQGDELIQFKVVVGEVAEEVLPELDDAWVQDHTEFADVEKFRSDTEDRLRSIFVDMSRREMVQATVNRLAELVTDEVPEALVDSEIDNRWDSMMANLDRESVELDDYLASINETTESLREKFREPAIQAVTVDLALRHVAEFEGLEPAESELDAYLAKVAGPGEAAKFRAALTKSGRLSDVRADLAKEMALNWLMERVEIVDADGEAIDRSELLDSSHDDDPQESSTTVGPISDKLGDPAYDSDHQDAEGT